MSSNRPFVESESINFWPHVPHIGLCPACWRPAALTAAAVTFTVSARRGHRFGGYVSVCSRCRRRHWNARASLPPIVHYFGDLPVNWAMSRPTPTLPGDECESNVPTRRWARDATTVIDYSVPTNHRV